MELDPPPRILVFSGDVDGCVPHLGTRRWVSSLGLHPVQPWRSWHSKTGAHVLELIGAPVMPHTIVPSPEHTFAVNVPAQR